MRGTAVPSRRGNSRAAPYIRSLALAVGLASGSLAIGLLLARGSSGRSAALAMGGVLIIVAFLASSAGVFEGGLLVLMILAAPLATTVASQAIDVGPLSATGALTGILAVATVPFWCMNAAAVQLVPGWLRAFLVWVVVASCLHPPSSIDGGQMIFVAFVFASALAISRGITEQGFTTKVDRAMTLAGWVAVLLYGLSLAEGGLGGDQVAAPRAYALLAIVILAWSLAQWRLERRARLLSMALLVMIALSLSRGALVAAIAMFCLAWFDLRGIAGWVKAIIALSAFALAIYAVPQLHDRFAQGDQAGSGGATINTTGRNSIWQAVWDDANKSLALGRGPGTGDELVARKFAPAYLGGPGGQDFVHNDYLRILHDYGLVGLLLWLSALFGMLRYFYRATMRRVESTRHHWAAYLALVGITLIMFVDNVVHNLTVMVPLGILIGIGMASDGERLTSQRETYARTAS